MAEATLSRQPTAPGIISRPDGSSSEMITRVSDASYHSARSSDASYHSAHEPELEPELDLMARLDADSVLHIAHFVGTPGVLRLCAVCHEWARVYQQAILRLRLSLVPLAGAPLSRVLLPLLRRMPALTGMDLTGSGACDGDVQIIGDAIGGALRDLRLNQCDRLVSRTELSPGLARAEARLLLSRVSLALPCTGRPDAGHCGLDYAWADLAASRRLPRRPTPTLTLTPPPTPTLTL